MNFLVAEILQNDKANQDRDAKSGGAATVTVGGAGCEKGKGMWGNPIDSRCTLLTFAEWAAPEN